LSIRLLGAGRTGNGIDFIALERADGSWSSAKTLTREDKTDLITSGADGYAMMHSTDTSALPQQSHSLPGMVHLDVKSDNILWIRKPDGHVTSKLTDFGTTKQNFHSEDLEQTVDLESYSGTYFPYWEFRYPGVIKDARSIDVFNYALAIIDLRSTGVFGAKGAATTLGSIMKEAKASTPGLAREPLVQGEKLVAFLEANRDRIDMNDAECAVVKQMLSEDPALRPDMKTAAADLKKANPSIPPIPSTP